MAVVAAAGTTAFRALRACPARVRVRPEQLTPVDRTPEDTSWHPHVTSGCGR